MDKNKRNYKVTDLFLNTIIPFKVLMSSLLEEGISEQYMVINFFSQLLAVIFQNTKPFLWTIHGYDVEWLFFYFVEINDRWCYWWILVVQIIHGIYGSPTTMPSSCSYSFWFRSSSVMFSSLLAEQLLWQCCFRMTKTYNQQQLLCIALTNAFQNIYV